MTLPRHTQQPHHDAKGDGPTHPEYEILGHFAPRDAKRILTRLEEQHLSFEANNCRQIRLFSVRNCVCIYVRREEKEKAEAISDEESVRSRAVAGVRYVAIGGVICTIVLLQMRSGVRTVPYRSGQPLPLEFVAGIAGIVVFMGFVQLMIAIILKLRRRQ